MQPVPPSAMNVRSQSLQVPASLTSEANTVSDNGQKGDQDSPTPTRVKLLRSKSATLIPGSYDNLPTKPRPLSHHSTQTLPLPFSLIGLFPESQVLSNSPEADVFLKLCESIIEFLAGLSCQTFNPLQIIPDQSDEALPLRQPSRTTTSAEVKGSSGCPETGGNMPDSPQFLSHGCTQAVDIEVDQAERSACQALNLEGYWHSRRARITKIMLTLTTWQDDFDQDELRQVFSGKSLLPEFNVEAAKQDLIGIGENLVQSE
ncbi:hypothetical protein F25303_4084 [Fusarium sp. NRRL 25303]|nr:hypothetical protein F25303_4084 [Fusarium sp. NRRL 25303]